MRKVLAIALFVTIVVAGFGQAVLQLWNWLMPAIFGLPHIGFGQALGLLALSWILFGGMRGMHTGRRRWRNRGRYRNFAAENLTPEQRAELREKFGRRCGPQTV